MRTTTTLLAVGATALALPAAAHAATPSEAVVRVPLAGHVTVESQMHAAHVVVLERRLTRRATRIARRLAHARHHSFSTHHYRLTVAGESPHRLAGRVKHLRRSLKRLRDRQAAAARWSTASPALEAIARCESGGNPATDTGNGFYGKYQFDLQTWAAVGGHGNPARASEAEQNRRATMLYARAGASPWPVCGR